MCETAQAQSRTPEVFPTSRLIGVCIAMTALADWLFWKQPIGWPVGGFMVLLLGVVLVTCPVRWCEWPVRALTIAILGLGAQCVEEPNPVAIILCVMALFSLTVQAREGATSSAIVWFERTGVIVLTAWQSPAKDAFHWARDHGPDINVRRTSSAWALPLMLDSLLFLLLAQANPILAQWWDIGVHNLERTLDWILQSHHQRLLFWLVMGSLIWGLVRFRSGVSPDGNGESPVDDPSQWPSRGLIVRTLLLLNVIAARRSEA